MAGLIGAHINSVYSSYNLLRPSCLRSNASIKTETLLRNPPSAMIPSKTLLVVAASLQQPSMNISSVKYRKSEPSEDVLKIWRSANAVCFDVDSTVCLEEGIDELADFCGAGKVVAEWTTRISPGIVELIKKLMVRNTDVYLVSGGFRQMINAAALQLGIPLENIFANQLLFGNSGEFIGFDAKEPTSRSGGKATAVQKIHNYKTMVMIGDGATDLEARKQGGADLFICYAGVQLREAVAAKADWLVFDFEELLSSLQ